MRYQKIKEDVTSRTHIHTQDIYIGNAQTCKSDHRYKLQISFKKY